MASTTVAVVMQMTRQISARSPGAQLSGAMEVQHRANCQGTEHRRQRSQIKPQSVAGHPYPRILNE
jgi:hypothetical protein